MLAYFASLASSLLRPFPLSSARLAVLPLLAPLIPLVFARFVSADCPLAPLSGLLSRIIFSPLPPAVFFRFVSGGRSSVRIEFFKNKIYIVTF